jgi:hypothetical protein
LFGYAHHTLILLLSIAVAGLALFGAIAVGPYGRRGLRTGLAGVAFVAFLGSVFWLVTYLSFIEERRSIEGRLSELRGQALRAGSTLACLEHTGASVETACAQTLFGAPESLAAAHLYMGARLDLLTAARRYTGPRTAEFDIAVAALQRSLEQDPFGLTSRTLVLRQGCTAQRCDALAAFQDTERLRNNIRQDTFATNVARYAGVWQTPVATTSSAPFAAPPAPALAPASETKAPIPEKYTFPSASSIPPVSIMDDEPTERPAAAPAPGKDRTVSQQTAPAAAASSDQPTTRREPKRANAPLSITPK